MNDYITTQQQITTIAILYTHMCIYIPCTAWIMGENNFKKLTTSYHSSLNYVHVHKYYDGT